MILATIKNTNNVHTVFLGAFVLKRWRNTSYFFIFFSGKYASSFRFIILSLANTLRGGHEPDNRAFTQPKPEDNRPRTTARDKGGQCHKSETRAFTRPRPRDRRARTMGDNSMNQKIAFARPTLIMLKILGSLIRFCSRLFSLVVGVRWDLSGVNLD